MGNFPQEFPEMNQLAFVLQGGDTPYAVTTGEAAAVTLSHHFDYKVSNPTAQANSSRELLLRE